MPRRNRVDPWGDLHAVPERGLFTGNRGCVVDDHERVVRHHGSNLWIICRTSFRGWRVALARPGRWTPLFFLDDAVGLAAGHRPCATCRRDDYDAYRRGVEAASGGVPAPAAALNARLQRERLRPGRGLERAADRVLHTMRAADVPDGAVVVDDDGAARLVHDGALWRFTFAGWTDPVAVVRRTGDWRVLTPPTSVAALAHGFTPTLHPSAGDGQGVPNP